MTRPAGGEGGQGGGRARWSSVALVKSVSWLELDENSSIWRGYTHGLALTISTTASG